MQQNQKMLCRGDDPQAELSGKKKDEEVGWRKEGKEGIFWTQGHIVYSFDNNDNNSNYLLHIYLC